MATISAQDDRWIHDPYGDEFDDEEWEDFDRLMSEYRLRRLAEAGRDGGGGGDGRGGYRRGQDYVFYPAPASSSTPADDDDFDYVQTVMYGRYTKDLGEFAKEEARRAKAVAKARRKEDSLRNKELGVGLRRENKCVAKVSAVVGFIWKHTFARLGEDWVFLALLGLIMAMLSFVMDHGISLCNKARIWLYRDLAVNPFVKYVAWVSLPLFLILFSAGFVHIVAPQSIGV